MNGSVRIWLAAPEDLDDVARLMIAFRDWWQRDVPGDDAMRRGCARLLEDADTEFLLARVGDEPAGGIAQLRYRYSLWVDALDCLLEDLFVDDSVRGMGLGRQLVEAAVARAQARGAGRIELGVNEANRPAFELYAKLGFSAWSDPPGGNDLMARRYLPR